MMMENMDMQATERSTPAGKGDPVALMYPGNQLKAQARPLEQTLSAFKVMNDEFFTKK